MWHPKLRGYMYEIVELFPVEGADHGMRIIQVYDRLEDAEKVMAVLESVNYNFTTYGMMMRPVWEPVLLEGWDANGSPTNDFPNPCSEILLKEPKPLRDITWIDFKEHEQKACDHSGSSSWISTNGESGWSCPKCGASSRTDPWI